MRRVSTIFILVNLSPHHIFHLIFDFSNIPPDYNFIHDVLDIPSHFFFYIIDLSANHKLHYEFHQQLFQLVYNTNLPTYDKLHKLHKANLSTYYILNFLHEADISSHNYELNQNHRISLHIHNYDLCNPNLRIPVW
jgi:hypothetical protein